MFDDAKRRILEYVLKNGPTPIYKLAKELGLSYGSVQWHVLWLEKAGFVKSAKIGKRRYVAATSFDLLKMAKTEDLIEDLKQSLNTLGVRPEMSLEEALAILESKGERKLADLIVEVFLGRRAETP